MAGLGSFRVSSAFGFSRDWPRKKPSATHLPPKAAHPLALGLKGTAIAVSRSSVPPKNGSPLSLPAAHRLTNRTSHKDRNPSSLWGPPCPLACRSLRVAQPPSLKSAHPQERPAITRKNHLAAPLKIHTRYRKMKINTINATAPH